jgi:hypothetical protein
VDIPEAMERDKSGMEPAELVLLLLMEVSGRELRAADMAGHSVCINYGLSVLATVERDGVDTCRM